MYILTITRSRTYPVSLVTRERNSTTPLSATACFEIMKLALEDLDKNETVSFKLSLSK